MLVPTRVSQARPPLHCLASLHLASLFSKGDPYPEPGYHLDEDEGKEDSVLEAIAAPAGRRVGWVMRMRRGMMCEAASSVRRVVQRRGCAEGKGVKGEKHRDEEA